MLQPPIITTAFIEIEPQPSPSLTKLHLNLQICKQSHHDWIERLHLVHSIWQMKMFI